MKTTAQILRDILKTMDIPEFRRDTDDPNNLRWLLRNIRINNSEHPKIDQAIELIKFYLPASVGE